MSSPGFVLFGALAVIVGALIPVQAATNAAMSRVIGSVAITSLALFAIGFVVPTIPQCPTTGSTR
jgi:uncharacterized membrane protein YdcZ (DUF606 family)